MNNRRFSRLTFVALLLALGLSACGRATPPGPDMAGGGYENTGYEFFHWQAGLDVLLWHEAVTDSRCDSSGEAGADTHFVQCLARTEAGIEFGWQIATQDGRSADFMLDGQTYDLAEGTVFLINIENGILDVQQLQRDLSSVAANHDSITQFALADPDISQFIETASPNN